MISFHDLESAVDTLLHGRAQTWTIADEGGNPIIGFKSFIKAEYKSAGKVVFEPVELNSFAAYNKTTEPREYSILVALQEPNNDFAGAMFKLEELKNGTELFSFLTPYLVFNNLTLESYSTAFEDTSNMMLIELHCKEILQIEQGYTNVEVKDSTPINQGDAKNPSNANTSGTGITNTNSPTSAEKQQGRESILHSAGGTIIPSSRYRTQASGRGGGGGY